LHIKPSLGGVKLSKLTDFHIEQFYAGLEKAGVGSTTRKMCSMILGKALRRAVKLKLISASPATDVSKPRREQKEIQFLDDAQIRAFLQAARSHRLSALFTLAVATGARQGELLGLRWSDVDFDKGTISIARTLTQVGGEYALKETKSKASRRTITLPAFAVQALREHQALMLREGNISNPVFCSRPGNFIGRVWLLRMLRPILRKASLPEITFHALRHTHATSLLASGHSIKAVAARLGHSDVKVTLSVYAHVLSTDDAKLAARLDQMFG
jgi:integrase